MQSKRTQAERSAATRAALIGAARPLFAEHGYAAVGTEAIVAAAGVSRGALYHQFADKLELFAAVFEQVEEELTARIGALLGEPTDPLGALEAGASAWLQACAEPEIHRIVLIEGPAVLGWQRWREIGLRYGTGLLNAVLEAAVDAGQIPPQPLEPVVHLLIGALDEIALYCAAAEDPARARREVEPLITRLIAALT
jgi:AcrR family transcriptional regulator